MRKTSLWVMAILLFSVFNLRCSSGSDLLSSGSSLMNMLGGQPNLSSLTSLLKTPGLGKMLGGVLKKPFTLLAPTNDALASLGGDAVANLTKPENLGQLAGLLKNHIIPGKQDAAAIMKGGLTSAGGNALNAAGAKLGDMVSSEKFNIIPVDKVMQ